VSQSGLIVVVPEAEPLVGAMRWKFDESARLGAPAHITVLFPFMEPERIDDVVLEKCARTLSTHKRFAFQLHRVGRFPTTAYLEPDPQDSFVALTVGLAQAVPDYPPFRGRFTSIIPHLTVAQGDASEAETAAQELTSRLKSAGSVSCLCAAVTLIENSSLKWKPMHVFPLT
jgi:2'-5' RNA ligase